MRILWIMAVLLSPWVCFATQVDRKSLTNLVDLADHVIIGRVILVDMVDGGGNQVTNLTARTGPGLPNVIRLHVAVQTNGVLSTTAVQIPSTLIVPLWSMFHFTLGTIKKHEEGKDWIFLLKGADFQSVYPAEFYRKLSEREEIERLIQRKKTQNPPSDRTR